MPPGWGDPYSNPYAYGGGGNMSSFGGPSMGYGAGYIPYELQAALGLTTRGSQWGGLSGMFGPDLASYYGNGYSATSPSLAARLGLGEQSGYMIDPRTGQPTPTTTFGSQMSTGAIGQVDFGSIYDKINAAHNPNDDRPHEQRVAGYKSILQSAGLSPQDAETAFKRIENFGIANGRAPTREEFIGAIQDLGGRATLQKQELDQERAAWLAQMTGQLPPELAGALGGFGGGKTTLEGQRSIPGQPGEGGAFGGGFQGGQGMTLAARQFLEAQRQFNESQQQIVLLAREENSLRARGLGIEADKLAFERQRLEKELGFKQQELQQQQAQFSQTFGEDQRQFNQRFGLDERIFGEDQRQFNVGQSGFLNGQRTLEGSKFDLDKQMQESQLAANPRNYVQNLFYNRGQAAPPAYGQAGQPGQSGQGQGNPYNPPFLQALNRGGANQGYVNQAQNVSAQDYAQLNPAEQQAHASFVSASSQDPDDYLARMRRAAPRIDYSGLVSRFTG